MNKKLKNLKTFEDYFYMDKEEIKEPQIDKEWGDEEEVPTGADHDDWDDEEEVKEVDQEVVGNEDEDCEDCDDEVEEFVDREFENVLSFEKFSEVKPTNEALFLSKELKKIIADNQADYDNLGKFIVKMKKDDGKVKEGHFTLKEIVERYDEHKQVKGAKGIPTLTAIFTGKAKFNKNDIKKLEGEIACLMITKGFGSSEYSAGTKEVDGYWVNTSSYGYGDRGAVGTGKQQ